MARSPAKRMLNSASGRPRTLSSFPSRARMFAVARFCFLWLFLILMVTAFSFSHKLGAGIIDPLVEDSVQDDVEAPGDLAEVLEREVALAELVVQKNPGYDAVCQGLDPLGRGVVKRARRGLRRVGQHDDGGHLRPGPRPLIPVVFLSHDAERQEVLGLLVKIGDQGGPMVLLNDVDDGRGQLVRSEERRVGK